MSNVRKMIGRAVVLLVLSGAMLLVLATPAIGGSP